MSNDGDEARRSITWVIVGVIVVVLVGVGIWGAVVGFSGTYGAGNVHRANQDATNRINSQAHFEDLYGDIKSYETQLVQAGQDKADGTDPNAATNYTGLYNTCVSAVNQYNQDSKKTTFKDWKDADLPETIDVSVCNAGASATPTASPTQ